MKQAMTPPALSPAERAKLLALCERIGAATTLDIHMIPAHEIRDLARALKSHLEAEEFDTMMTDAPLALAFLEASTSPPAEPPMCQVEAYMQGAAEPVAVPTSQKYLPTTHSVKCWQPFFQDIIDGKKTFEVRHNDRGYETGDYLMLNEWDIVAEKYTGRSRLVLITYTLAGEWLKLNQVAMSIALIHRPSADGGGK